MCVCVCVWMGGWVWMCTRVRALKEFLTFIDNQMHQLETVHFLLLFVCLFVWLVGCFLLLFFFFLFLFFWWGGPKSSDN